LRAALDKISNAKRDEKQLDQAITEAKQKMDALSHEVEQADKAEQANRSGR